MPNRSSIALASRICRYAHSYLEAQLKAHGLVGMVPSHGDILMTLYKKGEISMQELAKSIDRTKATTTVLVDKLEAGGLILREKSPQDNRSVIVKLTEQGQSFEPLFTELGGKLNEQVLGALSEQEAELLENLLQKVVNSFEQ